jgi:hypothetical protein
MTRSGGSAMVAATLSSRTLVKKLPNLARLVRKIVPLRMLPVTNLNAGGHNRVTMIHHLCECLGKSPAGSHVTPTALP